MKMKGGDIVEHGHSRLHAVYNNTSLFRIAYILDLFLCSVGYINVVAEVGKIFFFAWGLSIFLNKYILDFNIKKINYYGWLLLFIATNTVTMLIHWHGEGVWENLLMILNMPIMFFLFYGLHSEGVTEDGRKKIFKELYILSNIFLWLSLVINIISIIALYVVGKSVSYSFGSLVVYENRFTGLYYNPNLMAFSSFCSAFCCHLLWQNKFSEFVTGKPVSLVKKVIIIVSIAANLTTILLSDSNATALILICYTITFICYRYFGGKEVHFGIIVKKGTILLVAFALITAGVFTFRSAFQTGATQTMNPQEETINTFDDSDDELNKITFEHQNKNLDSGRIKLFKQSINVIKHHPIFGVGKGNITMYGNRYNDNKMKYSDFHNGYITIIVCSGFVGFIFFLGFAICLGWRMLNTIFRTKPVITSDIFPCMASFIAAYCVYSFFEKTMVFEVSFMITFFWLILGYATACMAKYEGERYKEYAFSSLILFKKLKPIKKFQLKK